MSAPRGSRWANGFSESRPIFFGVESPSQYAINAWLASCMVSATKSAINT